MSGEHEKSLWITSMRWVVYKLFKHSPKIPIMCFHKSRLFWWKSIFASQLCRPQLWSNNKGRKGWAMHCLLVSCYGITPLLRLFVFLLGSCGKVRGLEQRMLFYFLDLMRQVWKLVTFSWFYRNCDSCDSVLLF